MMGKQIGGGTSVPSKEYNGAGVSTPSSHHENGTKVPAPEDKSGTATLVADRSTTLVVPPGYKQTKVGVVPEDWEVVRFNNIFERVTRKNTTNNTNVLTISAQHGLINQKDFFNKSVASKDLSGYILLKKGEFAYNKSYSSGYPMGAFKRLNFYDEGVLSSLYIYFKIKDDNSDFYEQYFEAGLMNKEIYKIAQEGARNHGLLNMSVKEFFHDMLIIKPPLIEQQKIAQILTTWDDAISKQEALIEAKEQLKKGLMQKLLSGEVRFGITGAATSVAADSLEDNATKVASPEWEEVRMGDIGTTYGGLTGKKAEDFGVGNAKYVTYKNIFDNSQLNIDLFENVKIAPEEPQNKVEYGDILFTTSSETPEEVGMSSVLLDNIDELYLNSFCFGYRVNDIEVLNPHFARFYFRSFYMRDKISRLAQGSTRFNLSKLQVMKIKVKLPPKQEQQKIAQVLTTADKEIALLKEELETLKEQKRGLMQRLLSGEVRTNKTRRREND